MIFVLAERGAGLFVMLTEQDVNDMRAGHTKFVDRRQLKGETFGQVIVSLHKTNQAALDVVARAGHKVPDAEGLPAPQPYPHQSRCAGCDGLVDTAAMWEGKCIVCWANQATLYKSLLQDRLGDPQSR